MPTFTRDGGAYVATQCTFEERSIFQNAGWVFDPRLRKWTTHELSKAATLIEYADAETKTSIDRLMADESAAMDASWAVDTDFEPPVPDGLAYMGFQKAGIEYILEGTHTLLADPPGLGKTIQAIGTNNCLKPGRVLVVCPASLKINWKREWEKWDIHGQSVGIAHTQARAKTVEGGVKRWTELVWPSTDVVIINYDLLYKFDSWIKAEKWSMAIFDEAHMLKTRQTARTRCVFGGTKKARRKDGKTVEKSVELLPIAADYNLYLTGTPILSRPAELWTLIKVCDPKGLGRKYDAYVNEYCDATDTGFGIDVSGSTNPAKLNKILRERFMVRRDKKEVLPELPDKRRELIVLPQDGLEKAVKKERTRMESSLHAFEAMMGIPSTEGDFRYITMIDDLTLKIQNALDSQSSEDPDWNRAIRSLSEPDQLLFTELSEAREEVALAKVGMVVERVQNILNADEPVILFAYHKSVVKALAERLRTGGARVGVITGDVTVAKRQQIVDDFQDDKLDVILGNILALGVGWTLTRASVVVFAELDWVPAMIEQAEDRAWRIGQKNAVLVLHLVVDGSIESRMIIRVLEKMEDISAILDDKQG